MTKNVKGVNWNSATDPINREVWDRLTSNFWLDTAVPLSGDIASFRKLSPKERDTFVKVFTGLTVLDSLQGAYGAVSMIDDTEDLQEQAVYQFISAQEAIHAKSYSTIFSTLIPTPEINEAFDWAEASEYIQNKAKLIKEFYSGKDKHLKKIGSVILESFLFYTGFYYIFHLASQGITTASCEIIRLILRDENLHGYFIGYKYQTDPELDKETYEDMAINLAMDLMDLEIGYAHTLYDELGLFHEVEAFLQYNCNKALANLGIMPIYPKETATPPPEIIASLDPTGNSNHDFFSAKGSSYTLVSSEESTDEDWEF